MRLKEGKREGKGNATIVGLEELDAGLDDIGDLSSVSLNHRSQRLSKHKVRLFPTRVPQWRGGDEQEGVNIKKEEQKKVFKKRGQIMKKKKSKRWPTSHGSHCTQG